MQHTTGSMVAFGVVALATVGFVAGCAGNGDTGGSSATATATETVTAAPSASSGSPTSTPTADTQGGTGGTDAGGRCAASALTGSIEPGSGGAAGSTIVHLVLTNTGSTTCTLQGWPGVSFVGGGDGEQIGAAATQDQGTAHPTVTLAAGAKAVAPLKIGQAGNYSTADCGPRTPDGFRVYPPGSKQSLFIADTEYQACSQQSAPLLAVQALVPEGQATS